MDVVMKAKNELDQRVGERLRGRRLKMGLSQTELGAAAGVSFQQVQKYERGTNRISASRMIQFAEKLGVSAAYFVEGFDGESKAIGNTIKSARAIDLVAASNEGTAVLEAMAQMKPNSSQIHGDASTSCARDGVSGQSGARRVVGPLLDRVENCARCAGQTKHRRCSRDIRSDGKSLGASHHSPRRC
jgi:transcriptional regulator with XRE-family HTH domain